MLDFAKVKISAGNGGRGSVSFRREKFVPKGGPDGGEGGNGGNFYITASNDVSTLLDFQFLDHFEAPSGEHGDVGLKAGKDGKDFTLKVPVGSVIKINKLVTDIAVNKKRKRDHREPNEYQQKVFNYKKMEKLKLRQLGYKQQDLEASSVNSAGKIEADHLFQITDQDLVFAGNKLDEQPTQSISNSPQEVFSDSHLDQAEETSTEKYKVYKFSNQNLPNAISNQVQKADNKYTTEYSYPPIFDLDHPGATILIARGGKGGRGNTRFKSNQNKAPHFAEPGQKGEFVEIEISLKMVANIGIIGLPNAGKSTLLSKLTAASPKIANYPFTTIEPNLGVTQVEGNQIVLADIPGLIEGASEGKGLGFKFLKHTERTQVLLHLIALPQREFFNSPSELVNQILNSYRTVRDELQRYGKSLTQKPELVVINKTDILDPEQKSEYLKPLEKVLTELNLQFAFISAQEQVGLNGLKKIISQIIDTQAEI